MKTFKFLVVLLIPIFIGLSCAKEEEPKSLSKEEALELVTSTSEEMDLVMNQMMETQGMETLTFFGSLMISEPSKNNTNINSLVSSAKRLSKPFQGFYNDFVFPINSTDDDYDTPFGNYGTYTWDFDSQDWLYTQEPSDRIVFIFPSNAEQTTNDASLTISNIIQSNIDNKDVITEIEVKLLVDDAEVFSFSYNAVVSENSIDKVTFSIRLIPFFIESNIVVQGENMTISFEMKKAGIPLMSSYLELVFEDDITSIILAFEDDSYEDMNEPLTVRGYLQMGSLKVTFDLDIIGFEEASDTDIEKAANDYLKVKLYSYPQGQSVAYVKWYYNQEIEDIEPFLVFSDGSEMPAEEFLPDFFEDFEIEFD